MYIPTDVYVARIQMTVRRLQLNEFSYVVLTEAVKGGDT